MSNDVMEAAHAWALALPEMVECHSGFEHGYGTCAAGCDDGYVPNPVRAAVLALVEVPCGETRDQRDQHAMLDMLHVPGEPHDKCSYCGNTEMEGYGSIIFDLDDALEAFPEPARDAVAVAVLRAIYAAIQGVTSEDGLPDRDTAEWALLVLIGEAGG